MITTVAFWKGAGERALKTFLQAFIATLSIQIGVVLTGPDLVSLPWLTALATGGAAAFLSLATSVGNASFTAGEVIAPIVVEYSDAYAKHEETANGLLDGYDTGYDGIADDNPQRKV